MHFTLSSASSSPTYQIHSPAWIPTPLTVWGNRGDGDLACPGEGSNELNNWVNSILFELKREREKSSPLDLQERIFLSLSLSGVFLKWLSLFLMTPRDRSTDQLVPKKYCGQVLIGLVWGEGWEKMARDGRVVRDSPGTTGSSHIYIFLSVHLLPLLHPRSMVKVDWGILKTQAKILNPRGLGFCLLCTLTSS